MPAERDDNEDDINDQEIDESKVRRLLGSSGGTSSYAAVLRSSKRSYQPTRSLPFHLLATLYLDGRSKPERSTVVYLDPSNPDFPPHYYSRAFGETMMRSRWVQGDDGTIRQHRWVFKDIGIETLFDKLQLDGEIASEGKIYKKDEDDIVAAMHSTGLDEKEERPGQGQIVVTISRVVVSNPYKDPAFRTQFQDGEDDVGMKDEEGLSHTTR